MQGQDKWHAKENGYGYRRRTKRMFSLLEPKGKPDPVKYYFFAGLFILLGVMGSLFNQHQIEESRFRQPIAISVKFVEAICHGQSVSGKHVVGPYMLKTYVYSPQQAVTYKTYDSIDYATQSDCEADLQKANAIFPRTQVWYDQSAPWDARWTLDEPSPIRVFGYASLPAGILLLVGLLTRVRRTRQGGNKRSASCRNT